MDWGAYPHPRHPRCKAGVHSWLIVFLDSLLSQRMTERETGMTEWGHTLHHRHRRGSLFIFCFSGTGRQRSAGGFVWFNYPANRIRID